MVKQRQILRIKFDMNPIGARMLFNELNDLLRTKESYIKPTPRQMRGDEREDFRVIFDKDVSVSIHLRPSKSVPTGKIKCVLVDLSLGGACLALASDDLILPNTLGTLRLDFLPRPLSLKMTILDSKMK